MLRRDLTTVSPGKGLTLLKKVDLPKAAYWNSSFTIPHPSTWVSINEESSSSTSSSSTSEIIDLTIDEEFDATKLS